MILIIKAINEFIANMKQNVAIKSDLLYCYYFITTFIIVVVITKSDSFKNKNTIN